LNSKQKIISTNDKKIKKVKNQKNALVYNNHNIYSLEKRSVGKLKMGVGKVRKVEKEEIREEGS